MIAIIRPGVMVSADVRGVICEEVHAHEGRADDGARREEKGVGMGLRGVGMREVEMRGVEMRRRGAGEE